jgi:hypothetical protein
MVESGSARRILGNHEFNAIAWCTPGPEHLGRSLRDHEKVYEALEVICKGPEVALPAGFSLRDKEGKVRHEVRVRWWQNDLSTYR